MIKKSTPHQKSAGPGAKLIVILGPTASGKTGLSLKLAKKFKGEIVNADSRQIYKYMDIATAKEPGTWKNHKYYINGVAHHLIDFVEPNKEYTLAQFQTDAVKKIKEIQNRGKTPFLVGGTGLYISSVVDNYLIPKGKPNKKLRAKLEKELKEKGLEYLWHKLIQKDPGAQEVVDKYNPRRVIRALEVVLGTGKPFSQLRLKREPIFDILQIGIRVGKRDLEKRVNQRAEKMVMQGLLDETRNLLKKGYKANLPSMSGIGYKEAIQYFLGQISFDQMKDLIKQNTRRYAKRQMTWFKKDKRIIWIRDYHKAERAVKKFLVHSL